MREDQLVRKLSEAFRQSRDTSAGVLLGIGDDAALFRPRAGRELILTCDWFLEGRHFLRAKHPPDSVGWKCLARAVSDIAAMGGSPRCFLLSLALPASLTGHWLDQFLSGLRHASWRFQCALAGGDTTRRDKILINIMVLGDVQTGRAIRRSGARPGDLVCVSGRLGEAELGLQMLKRSRGFGNPKNPLTKKPLYPEPRLALGRWLATKGLASAMMDLSDGLSSDLPRLCASSGVGVRLKTASLPLVRLQDAHKKGKIELLRLALHGGDDYELLFTVRPKKARQLPQSLGGVPLSRVGVITSERKIVLVDENGRERTFNPGGWDPFCRGR